MEKYTFKPIGYVKNPAISVPRNWSVSNLEGELVIDPRYKYGLKDIKAGDKIFVIFCFHKSAPFEPKMLIQKPPHLNEMKGVFSTFSPHRPNPIGLSILEVTGVFENIIKVRRLDMYDNTPILDIKPYLEYKPMGDQK